MSKDEDTMPTTFSKKYMKMLKTMPEFKDTADAASTEDLKKIIVEAEGNIYTIDKAAEANTTLIALKEQIKDITGANNDAKKYQMTKINYALFLLEGKGESLDSRTEEE
jgi:hypothetical protein